MRIGELLVHEGLIDKAQLEEALTAQQIYGGRLGTVLVEHGFLKEDALANVLAGKEEYEVTEGEILFKGEDLIEEAPEDRAREGIFMAFQYPVEIPGVSNSYFLKAALNAVRAARGEEELDAFDFLARVKEKAQLVGMDESFLQRCALHHVEGNYLFVHAGLARELLDESDLGYVLRRSRAEDLLWNRSSIDLPHRLGCTIVYGHTPSPDFQVRWNPPFCVGIDTGAVYGGPLTALRLPDETVFQA